MLGAYAISRPPLAARLANALAPGRYEGFVDFDIFTTIISQYRNSPILMALCQYMEAWVDGSVYDDFFYKNIWDLSQARDFGLDILGRIVGASRIIVVPSDADFIGFDGQPTAQNWGHGIWYRGANATSNVRLGDPTYRRVILAKARANVCGCTIPELNALLMLLFPDYGNSYVIDNQDGSITFHFGAQLTAVDFALISQPDLLPRPLGRRVIIEQG